MELFDELWDQALLQLTKGNGEKILQIREACTKVFGTDWDFYINPTAVKSLKKTAEYTISSYNRYQTREGMIDAISATLLNYNPFYRLVLHFPELTITNTRGTQHKIKDFYMCFDFTTKMLLNNSKGLRATMTYEEYTSGYGHSHLSGGIDGRLSTLCYGSGPLRTTVSYMNHTWSIDHFTLMLMHAQNFARWESIEGVPYHRIDNIGSSTIARRIGLSDLEDMWDEYSAFITASDFRNTLTPYLKNGRMYFTYNESFEEILGNLFKQCGLGDPYTCIKGEDGKMYSSNIITQNSIVEDVTSELLFKGDYVIRTVQNINSSEKKILYANKSATEYVIRQLTQLVRGKLFSCSINRTFPESEHEDFPCITTANDLVM